MKIYNNGKYIEKNLTWHVEDSPWKAKQIIKIIQKNNINPNSICEVGCGAGEILNQLYGELSKDIMYYGYEISRDAFNLCKQREQDKIKYFLKDFIKEENVYFDVLLAIDLVEHIEDYIGFLKKFREKGEYKIFHIPLEIFVVKALLGRTFVDSREKYGHIHYFNKEIMLAVLKDTGYEIIDYFYTGGAIELSGISTSLSFKSRLLKFPRKIMFYLSKDLTVKTLGGYSLLILAK